MVSLRSSWTGRKAAVAGQAEWSEVEEAARAVVEAAADLALSRTARLSLAETCAKLGIDPAQVVDRAKSRDPM